MVNLKSTFFLLSSAFNCPKVILLCALSVGCSVLDIEGEAEGHGGDTAVEGLLEVDGGVDGCLADLVQLPLESGAGKTGIVQSELPGVVALLQSETDLAVECLLGNIVFHLSTNGLLLSVLVEVQGSILNGSSFQSWGLSLDAETPLEALVEVSGQTQAPSDIIKWLSDGLPGLGTTNNHAAASPGQVHGATIVLGYLLHDVVLDRVRQVAHADIQWRLVLVVDTLEHHSHILKSLVFLKEKMQGLLDDQTNNTKNL